MKDQRDSAIMTSVNPLPMDQSKPGVPTSLTYKPTALVGGGAGFIGSFLCQGLLLTGCRVIAVDNLLTGKEQNLEKCFPHPDFKFLKHDLCRPLKDLGPLNYIFHLAGIEETKKFPLKHLAVNSEGTKNLLNLTQKTQAKFLLASSLESSQTAKSFAEKLTLEFHHQGVDARLARLGWVYGPRLNLESPRLLAQLFRQALFSSIIEVPGNGQQIIYPTFVSDAVYGLTKAIFATQTSGQIFNLIGPEKITLFDLAQRLKKNSPRHPQIQFIADSKSPSSPVFKIKKEQKTLGWQAKISLNEGLKRTFAYFHPSQESTPKGEETKPARKEARPVPLPISKQEKTRQFPQIKLPRLSSPSLSLHPLQLKKSKKFKIALFFLSLIFLFLLLLLPFYPFFFHSLSAAYRLHQASSNFQKGNLRSLEKNTHQAYLNFQKVDQDLHQTSQLYSFLGLGETRKKLVHQNWLATKVAKTAWYASQLAQNSQSLSRIILQKESGDLVQISSHSQVVIDTLWQEISFIQADLKSHSDSPFIPKIISDFFPSSQIEELLPQFKKALQDYSDFLTILPGFTGIGGKKTYLVLLQNNMELRPTGGFIGSFLLLTFDQGSLTNFEVYDVYSADGQLKGHVEPPEPIKKYLGEAGWYLRDSNWSPNFPTAALKASWFLEKTLSQPVDGVLAVNLNLPQKILAAVDGVELLDFQETITAENLYPKTQFYSEADFFPGSTQKKDFLGSLSRALLAKIKESSSFEQAKIAQAVYSSLQEKDLFISFNDSQLMETITSLGWEGSVRQPLCQTPAGACFVDSLLLVEANLGVNKANYYLQREIQSEISLSQKGTLTHLLKIKYQNHSSTNDRFGGLYKNYLRLFISLGTDLNWVKINGEELEKENLDLSLESGKTVIGFLVQVPEGFQKEVEISFTSPARLQPGVENDYLLYWQRQSGADPSPLDLKLYLPSQTAVLKTLPPATRTENGLQFQTKLDRDLLFQTKIKF